MPRPVVTEFFPVDCGARPVPSTLLKSCRLLAEIPPPLFAECDGRDLRYLRDLLNIRFRALVSTHQQGLRGFMLVACPRRREEGKAIPRSPKRLGGEVSMACGMLVNDRVERYSFSFTVPLMFALYPFH